jgi:ABC-type transport system substrate-binding protein
MLRVGVTNEPVSLDPPNQWDGASSRIISNVYETLVEYDKDLNIVIFS